jgi:shikimate dehydrogenase
MAKNYREELTGLLGFPVDENPTGAVMEAGYRALGLPFRYVTMLVRPEGLKDALLGLRAAHFRGVNLTIPHKVAAVALMDELSPAAKIVGAVNNVTITDGVLRGENTDGKGLLRSLRQNGADPKGKRLAILGAGGAARAIAVECALAGAAHITIVNRDPGRGGEVARLVREQTQVPCDYQEWKETARIPEGAELLVNATCVGLFPDSTARPDVDYSGIRPGMSVCDAVFNPPQTAFLREAARRGAKTINGLGMLVNQAALNFTIWTGREAPEAVMEAALRAEFGIG